ncbi:hypothetical protein Tco_0265116 [Tanacetum coccineum]
MKDVGGMIRRIYPRKVLETACSMDTMLKQQEVGDTFGLWRLKLSRRLNAAPLMTALYGRNCDHSVLVPRLGSPTDWSGIDPRNNGKDRHDQAKDAAAQDSTKSR